MTRQVDGGEEVVSGSVGHGNEADLSFLLLIVVVHFFNGVLYTNSHFDLLCDPRDDNIRHQNINELKHSVFILPETLSILSPSL